MYSELLKTYEQEGFTINIYAEEETIRLGEQFEFNGEELKEIYKKLNNYQMVYFMAKWTASKAGIELGTSYLGCCLYDNYEGFLNDCLAGVFDDCVETAINEAKKALPKLIGELSK